MPTRQHRTESWKGGWGLSLLLHGGLLALIVFGAAVLHLLPLGGAHPGTTGPGAIHAALVSELPGAAVPMPPPQNAVAQDHLASSSEAAGITRHLAPPPPTKNSVAIPAAPRPKMPDLAEQEALRELHQLARADVPKNESQVPYGAGGAPQFNYGLAGPGVGGGGGMAFGDAAFGTMYADWVNRLRDRLTWYWERQYRDPSVPTGRLVTIQFEVERNGQLTDIDFAQRTGIPDLDSMALHAVQQAASESFPLPAGYGPSRLLVRVTFELQ